MTDDGRGTSGGGRKPRIFTIGHADRALEEFIHILEASSVKMVVDIRSNPASVRFPHFERRRLASALDGAGINYRWFRSLGGKLTPGPLDDAHTALPESLRPYATVLNTPEIGQVVTELVGLASSAVTVLLCAERDPGRCHRSLLSDKMEQLGVRVVHIIDKDNARFHEPHPDLHSEDGRLIYRSKQLPLI